MRAWSPVTEGTADVSVIADPADAANYLVHLQTGSPAAIAQTIDTPDQPFDIALDYEFLTDAGTITVSLDGADLFTLEPPEPFAADRLHFAGRVDDAAWFGLTDVTLAITLDSATASQAYIDEVDLVLQIPEPASVLLMAGGAVLGVRRRR